MKAFRPFETSSVWQFTDPDTGYLVEASSREDLVKKIVSYRAQNKLIPIESLSIVLENYLCSLPCNVGKCRNIELKRGLLQYIKGGIALVENLMYSSFVDKVVADARASICKACTCNVFPDKDAFIRWSDMIAIHSVGDRKSIHYDELGNCLACSCIIKAKVWYPGPFELSSDEASLMQECNSNCWQLKEKENI